MKTCSKCLTEKQLTDFYNRTAYRPNDDGLDYYCRPCRNAATQKTKLGNKYKCTAENCTKPHYARNLCRPHYDKLGRQEKKRM